MEIILQSDFTGQPLECSIHNGCREGKKHHTNNDAETTRRLANKKYPRHLLHMIQKFAPEDNQEEDTETHSQIRKIAHKAPDTQNDEEFTFQEVTNVTQGMGSKKAPGEDGIPKEVWKCIGAMLPRYLTAI
jgi:hypothetical protein